MKQYAPISILVTESAHTGIDNIHELAAYTVNAIEDLVQDSDSSEEILSKVVEIFSQDTGEIIADFVCPTTHSSVALPSFNPVGLLIDYRRSIQ